MEAKEIIEYLGFDATKIADLEGFKKAFEPEAGKPVFIRADAVKGSHVYSSIVGELRGSIETKIKATAKKYAIDFTPEELKDKKVEELAELAFEKQAALNKTVVDELTAKVGQGNDEKVKEWESKYTKLEGKFNDTKSLLEKTSTDFTKFQEEVITTSKQRKVNDFKNGVFGKLKFRQNASELEKIGFNAKVAEKYSFDEDDKGEVFIKDAKTGARIGSTKVQGTFKTADEVLEEELIALGLHEKNPAGGRQVGSFGQQNQQQQQAPEKPKTGNRLHPSRAGA